MSDIATTGKCLCGAVSYRLANAPEGYGACHCGMCRRWAAGVMMVIEVPPGGITWQGTDALRSFASSDWAERGFCGTCGTAMFWRMTAPGAHEGMLAISAGTLDSLEGLTLKSEIFIDHKPAGRLRRGPAATDGSRGDGGVRRPGSGVSRIMGRRRGVARGGARAVRERDVP